MGKCQAEGGHSLFCHHKEVCAAVGIHLLSSPSAWQQDQAGQVKEKENRLQPLEQTAP